MSPLSMLLRRLCSESCGGVALIGGLIIGLMGTAVVAVVDVTNVMIAQKKLQHRINTVQTKAMPIIPATMEISMVLDVSGSMNWGISSEEDAPIGSRRIDALREGVETLVTSLETVPGIDPKMAVVPYATSVDVSGLIAQAPDSAAHWFSNIEGGPVPTVGAVSGATGRDAAPDPSPSGAWAAERYVAKSDGSYSLSVAKPFGPDRIPIITQPERETFCHDDYIVAFGSLCAEFVVMDDEHYSEKDFFAPRSGILPLTEEPQNVLDFMDTLQAQGGTAGHIGAAWGLYALAEEWGDVFAHPAGPPTRFKGQTQKVLIFMTDGDFTIAHDDAMTLGETYDYFRSVCSLAREKGVLIYTVGLRASAMTDKELTACAGGAERYHTADSRGELIEAFEKIAADASRIRLSS